jgi:hypothetical protein
MMPETLSCYGGLFPETLVKAPNQDVKGRVFGYRLDHHGVVESGLTVTTDRDAWHACTTCPELDGRYRLSVGRMLMEIAVRS